MSSLSMIGITLEVASQAARS